MDKNRQIEASTQLDLSSNAFETLVKYRDTVLVHSGDTTSGAPSSTPLTTCNYTTCNKPAPTTQPGPRTTCNRPDPITPGSDPKYPTKQQRLSTVEGTDTMYEFFHSLRG